MKRATILGLCVLIAATSPGLAATFTWNGASSGPGSSNAWSKGLNWQGTSAPSQQSPAADVIVIDAANLASPFRVTSDWAYSTSTTSDYTSVHVKSDATYAMILLKSGTDAMNPGALTLEGNSATKVATLDINQNSMNANSTSIKNFVDVVVADNKSVDLGDVTLDSASSADLEITGEAAASGTPKVLMSSYTGNSRPVSFVGPLIIEDN